MVVLIGHGDAAAVRHRSGLKMSRQYTEAHRTMFSFSLALQYSAIQCFEVKQI